MFLWIRHYGAEVCALLNTLLVSVCVCFHLHAFFIECRFVDIARKDMEASAIEPLAMNKSMEVLSTSSEM